MKNFSGDIHVLTDIFDDPLFFRVSSRTSLESVTSIPLTAIPSTDSAERDLQPPVHGRCFSGHDESQWAKLTTSLRSAPSYRLWLSQSLHPRDHVKEITRVHSYPTVMEDILATFSLRWSAPAL